MITDWRERGRERVRERERERRALLKAHNGTGMCVTEKRESLDLSIYLSLESEPLLGHC